jgi:hypothetical protein
MGRISQHLKVVRGWGLLALLLLAVAPAGALAQQPKPPVLPPTAHP